MFKPSDIKTNVILAPYTFYKIGGPAEMFFVANDRESLEGVLNYVIKKDISYIILGTGSNVLVPDEGLKGMVIINRASNFIYDEENKIVTADSGGALRKLVWDMALRGWAGLEYFGNIPGTVGGAVVGNAGANEHSISEEIKWIKFVDGAGEIIIEPRDFFNFEYRTSRLKQGYKAVVLEVCFSMFSKNPEEILKVLQEDDNRRKSNNPTGSSCGSFFKNISEDLPAGKIIDDLGLKGLQVGGAKVSEEHANFIVNTGYAAAKDVKELAEIVAKKVKEEMGYELEREVVYL